jgi:RNA-directed DNA polymerase
VVLVSGVGLGNCEAGVPLYRFYRSRMYPLLRRVNTYLMRWAGKKYKRLRACKRFKRWWSGVTEREPRLFAHWAWTRELAGLR